MDINPRVGSHLQDYLAQGIHQTVTVYHLSQICNFTLNKLKKGKIQTQEKGFQLFRMPLS
jgi:hypothetical protein